ncbi:hypothetical protein [Pseudomonas sp.]|uniref:ABC transporter C-terminal domain-containing protein n=1 Tax=Pseudomonas sp. TaxID=306 RepID=UPI003FA78559
MDAIATNVMEVQGGRVKTYLGSYSDYLWKKEQERVEAAGSSSATSSGDGRARPGGSPSGRRGPKSKEQKRREAKARQHASGAKTAARRERRDVQGEIARSEKRIEDLEIALLDSSVHADGKKMKELVTEQRELRSRVDKLYERWAELED